MGAAPRKVEEVLLRNRVLFFVPAAEKLLFLYPTRSPEKPQVLTWAPPNCGGPKIANDSTPLRPMEDFDISFLALGGYEGVQPGHQKMTSAINMAEVTTSPPVPHLLAVVSCKYPPNECSINTRSGTFPSVCICGIPPNAQ